MSRIFSALLYLVHIGHLSTAYPKSFATGDEALPSNGTWKNTTWSSSYLSSTTNSPYVESTKVTLDPVYITSSESLPLFSDIGTVSVIQSAKSLETPKPVIGISTSSHTTEHVPLLLVPTASTAGWRYHNGTFDAVLNSSLSGIPHVTGHVPPIPGPTLANSTGKYLNATESHRRRPGVRRDMAQRDHHVCHFSTTLLRTRLFRDRHLSRCCPMSQ